MHPQARDLDCTSAAHYGIVRWDDNELLNLPDDPELAFMECERLAREKLGRASSFGSDDTEKTANSIVYISTVLAAARHLELDILKGWEVPRTASAAHVVERAYEQFSSDVNYVIMQLRLKHARRTKHYSVALDPKTKAVIRHHLAQVKELVDRLDVPERKRNRLYAKISALENEVDRDRTRFDVVMSLLLEGSATTGKAAGNLEPVTKRIREITDIFGRIKEEEDESTPQLPAPQERKRIEPPRKRGAGPVGRRDSILEENGNLEGWRVASALVRRLESLLLH